MTYEDLSDTRAQWVYGAGLLWLYDVATVHAGSRTSRAEVVEVSTATGRVVRTVPTAPIYRPRPAADADGLWIGADLEGDVPPPAPTYHLAPGASAPRPAHRGGYVANWLVAAGHEVWEDIAPRPAPRPHRDLALRRANGNRPRARRARTTWSPAPPSCSPTRPRCGWSQPPPINSSASGCPGQQIVRIDARTGRQTVTRTLTLPDDASASPSSPRPSPAERSTS